jgi:hypothetical protein
MLKIVDIVQGFLGSGKTSLINHLIQNVFEDEIILVVLTEWGKTQVMQIGSRIVTYSWDWEQGFPLDQIRYITKMENMQRIIFEVNGFASGQELINVLTLLAKEGHISLGARIAVFNGAIYNAMGKPLEDIFRQMALTSDGFWINEPNDNLYKWLPSVKPDGCQTTGDDWAKWYAKVSKPQRKPVVGQLIPYVVSLMVIYFIFFFLLQPFLK